MHQYKNHSKPQITMSASARSGAKRLIKEMENWRKEQKDEKGVERLGPVNEDDLFEWEAVINGKGIGSGYDGESFCPCPLSSHPFLAIRRENEIIKKILTLMPQRAGGSSTSSSPRRTRWRPPRCAS